MQGEVLAPFATPDKVRELERQLLQVPQVDLQTNSIVHGAMCARTIFIPAGTVLTGAQLNVDNICVVVGDISVTTDEGVQRLTGHHVIKASAGYKRAGFAHANTWWTMLWHTELEDLIDIENEATDEAEMLQTRRTGIVYVEPQKLEA